MSGEQLEQVKFCPACGTTVEWRATRCNACGSAQPVQAQGTRTGRRQKLGYTGSALLLVGAFLPLVSLPIVGNISYMRGGQGDGILIVILAAASFWIVAKEAYRGLWLTGAISLCIIGFTFFRFQRAMSGLQDSMTDNPIGAVIGNMFQLQWGWVVLVAGAVLLLVCARSSHTAPGLNSGR